MTVERVRVAGCVHPKHGYFLYDADRNQVLGIKCPEAAMGAIRVTPNKGPVCAYLPPSSQVKRVLAGFLIQQGLTPKIPPVHPVETSKSDATIPGGGLIGALDRLRMRIPRSARPARVKSKNRFFGVWEMMKPGHTTSVSEKMTPEEERTWQAQKPPSPGRFPYPPETDARSVSPKKPRSPRSS